MLSSYTSKYVQSEPKTTKTGSNDFRLFPIALKDPPDQPEIFWLRVCYCYPPIEARVIKFDTFSVMLALLQYIYMPALKSGPKKHEDHKHLVFFVLSGV